MAGIQDTGTPGTGTQDTAAPGTGIVVTGLPRSGTSWVGKMMEAGKEVVYVNEPLNPQRPPGRSPGVLNAEVTHRFQYICDGNDERWLPAFRDTLRLRYHLTAELRRNHAAADLARVAKYLPTFTLGRLRGRRALIDDPFALLSSAWLAQRLGCRVVVLVRQPAAIVGSWYRLGWTVQFRELLDQPLLMRDLLGPSEDGMRAAEESPDRIEKIAVLWRTVYAAVSIMAEASPLIHIRRYEDLAADPVAGFRELYGLCGLAWTDAVQRRVVAAASATGTKDRSHTLTLRGGPARTAFRPMDSRTALTSYRQRLTDEQIAQARALTADVSKLYYPASRDLQTR